MMTNLLLLSPIILLALMVLCAIIQVELKALKGKTNQPLLKSDSNVNRRSRYGNNK